jgi:hypothetical protein
VFQHTIAAVLLPQALDLLCTKTLLFRDLEMPQRLSRRLYECILHAHGLRLLPYYSRIRPFVVGCAMVALVLVDAAAISSSSDV